ncbi:sodium-dependent glucose transporter 1A-like [Branchiostoma lanceolatum]|uniref:sodium-dependent glucose transporter 1A-like n=1 Tax=Branchiostoma lanceolatum TaxID=7740 RepID=UPI00345196DA
MATSGEVPHDGGTVPEETGANPPSESGRDLPQSKLQWRIQQILNLKKYARDYRVIKTGCLVLAWIAMGLYHRMVAPTLIDLKDRLGVNYEEISRALLCHTVGYFLSNMVGGVVVDLYPGLVDMVIASSLLSAGIGSIGTPWSRSLTLTGFCKLLTGFGHGATDAAGTVTVIQLWGDNSAPALHIIHMGYPFIALFVPFMAQPFLSRRPEVNGTVTPPPLTVEEAWRTSRIEQAYLIPTFVSFAVSVVFLSFHFYFSPKYQPDLVRPDFLGCFKSKKKTDPDASDPDPEAQPFWRRFLSCWSSFQGLFSPGRCVKGEPVLGSFYVVLLFLFYLVYLSGEVSLFEYLFAYSVESGLFDKDGASLVYSCFFLFFLLGRGFGGFGSHWVPVGLLIGVSLFLLQIVGIEYSVWGVNDSTVFWVLTCVAGFCCGPVFPACSAWANHYLDLTGVLVVVMFVGASFGNMIGTYATGYFFEYAGIDSMFHGHIGYMAITIAVFFTMQFSMSVLFKDRMQRAGEEEEDEEPEVEAITKV